MSVSSIPNLNSLRKSARGGGRGSLTSRGGQRDKDQIIRNTDGDASTSRMSAVDAGYLDDPFAKHLTDDNWQRRLPLMNRGTFIRTTALDKIVDTFLSSSDGRKQIISLGAGSDTRYFRLKRDQQYSNFVYHELDFRENNQTKISRLLSPSCQNIVRELCNVDLASAVKGDGELDTDEYHIHAMDLRHLPDSLEWLDDNAPTLLISECCLIYLPPAEADQVISYFTNLLPDTPLVIVIYEPFRPNDPFGRTMIRNLTTRGIVLETIQKYADLDSQRLRLTQNGFNAKAADTDYLWRQWVDQDQKDRIDKLEWMDEVEEFVLLVKHYCVAYGWRNFQDDTLWQALPSS